MLKSLTAGQQVALIPRFQVGSPGATTPKVFLSHPFTINDRPEFFVQWVLKDGSGYLVLLELYLWKDPEEITEFLDEMAQRTPDLFWTTQAGVQIEVNVLFPQTLVRLANRTTLTVLGDQEFTAALPLLQADIASRWHLPGPEWNARRREDVKAAFAL
jgi:hypothetical protein